MQDRQAAARLFRNARREAIIVLVIWALALVWTVGYCYVRGYQHPPDSWLVQHGWAVDRTAENFHQVAGLPDWIFLGILLPWLLCSAFTMGFCLGMKDDDLGTDVEEGAGHDA